MPDVRTIHVFIASPGDLPVERRAFKDVIDELNSGFGDGAGVKFAPLGWEDTLATTGRRSQSVINKEIDRCEVFILALHRRWGQEAPDAKPYTSYTEEEFHRALNRWKNTGVPEIFVFFKHVDAASMADPGEQLKKVLAFRKSLEESRKVLYHFFADEKEFRAEMDRHLRAYAKGELPKADVPREAVLLPVEYIRQIEQAKAEAQARVARANKLIRRFELQAKRDKRRKKASAKKDQKRDKVFVSYSHRDHKWLERLRTMLSPLVRNQSTVFWDDTKIKPGENWQQGIKAAISRAKVAVLLVSEHFLASDFIAENELPPILDAAKSGGLAILWVCVNHCMWKHTAIAEYQATHDPTRPLASLQGATRNQTLVEICEAIDTAFKRVTPMPGAAELAAAQAQESALTLARKAAAAAREGRVEEARQNFSRATDGTTNLEVLDLAAEFYTRLGEIGVAEYLLERSLALSGRSTKTAATAIALRRLGNIKLITGTLNNAETLFKEALAVEQWLDRQEGIAANFGNLGIIYQTRGDLDRAEEMHKKSLAIEEKLGRQEGMAADYVNLGLIYRTRGDLDRAEEMHKKSLAINEKLGRQEGVAASYGNLGVIYKTRGDLEQAEEMYKKSLAINEKLGRQGGMAINYFNLGVIAEDRRDFNTARELWSKARELYSKIGIPNEVQKIEGCLASLPQRN